MKKKCMANDKCPLSRGYDAIGDWWSLLILTRILLAGLSRFSELQEDLGMARNILTSRLNKLVEKDILMKVPASDGSKFFEYAPTVKGKDLYTTIVALRQWGEKHFFDNGCSKFLLVDSKKHEAVPPVEVRAADGRVLGLEDFSVTESN